MTDRTAQARLAAEAWFDRPVRLAPLGRGHINDTWLVRAGGGRFVLQRLSSAVFPDPRGIAAKVARVVDHLERNRKVRLPALVPAQSGSRWHEDTAGVWRLWRFLGGTHTLQRLTTPAHGRAAGAAFGSFQLAIADLPGDVAEPIPGFLRLSHYLAELDAAAASDVASGEVTAALSSIEQRRDLASLFLERDRLIHGDCKIDNLLFRRDAAQVAGIIDLDTVMLGHWAWDFGDLARSAAADGEAFDVVRFAAIATGFVDSGALPRAPRRELSEALVLAPRHLALMLAVRFLTDHLRGDRYFKVAARGENMRRAHRQLALLADMERQERAMATEARRVLESTGITGPG